MTLYNFIRIADSDYDCYDTVFDAVVTVCAFDEADEKNEDYYYQFIIGIMKYAQVIRGIRGSDCELIVDWTGMINRNIKVFKEFTDKWWDNEYEDEDDFLYDWVNEIGKWVAGYATENIYQEFVENYMPRLVYEEQLASDFDD